MQRFVKNEQYNYHDKVTIDNDKVTIVVLNITTIRHEKECNLHIMFKNRMLLLLRALMYWLSHYNTGVNVWQCRDAPCGNSENITN